MEKKIPDEIVPNLILVFSGGFQDAYTYIVRNKVFAKAQTGNIVLFSTYLMGGKFDLAIKYLFPIFAFMLGIFIAENIQNRLILPKWLHWKQRIVLFEIIVMIAVGFLPQSMNMLANCLVSFACALQLQAFNKLHGNLFASTMCVGNLKSGVSAFSSYLRTKDGNELSKVNIYFMVICIFAVGAGIGGNFSAIFGEKTIWVSAVLLLICFFLLDMYKKTHQQS